MKPKRIVAPDNSWEKWVLNNKIHREDGPAVIRYNDEKVIEEQWRVEGRLHRKNSPAIIRYKDGVVTEEQWWVNDKSHRKDAPAIIRYNDGVVVYEEWFTNNIRHREDGPAIIRYSDGAEWWWINGILLSKKDFTLDMIIKMKAYSLFSPIDIARMRKNET